MEDLRFCNEFMNKQQHNQTPHKHDEGSRTEDDFSLKYSGDEGINCVPICSISLRFIWTSVSYSILFFLVSLADDLPLADVCRRLSAENRNRNQNNKNLPAAPPE